MTGRHDEHFDSTCAHPDDSDDHRPPGRVRLTTSTPTRTGGHPAALESSHQALLLPHPLGTPSTFRVRTPSRTPPVPPPVHLHRFSPPCPEQRPFRTVEPLSALDLQGCRVGSNRCRCHPAQRFGSAPNPRFQGRATVQRFECGGARERLVPGGSSHRPRSRPPGRARRATGGPRRTGTPWAPPPPLPHRVCMRVCARETREAYPGGNSAARIFPAARIFRLDCKS